MAIVLDFYNNSVKKAGQVFITHFIIEETMSPWPKS